MYLSKFDILFNLIMQGLSKGAKPGQISSQIFEKYFPLSSSTTDKKIHIIFIGHALSSKKGHGLFKIAFSNDETYKFLDKAVSKIISKQISNIKDKYFLILFNQKYLSISLFVELNGDNEIFIKIMNAFHMKKNRFEKFLLKKIYVDSSGKQFNIINADKE